MGRRHSTLFRGSDPFHPRWHSLLQWLGAIGMICWWFTAGSPCVVAANEYRVALPTGRGAYAWPLQKGGAPEEKARWLWEAVWAIGGTAIGGTVLGVGKLLKGLRAGQGLSRSQVAQACGVTRAYISLLELGKRFPGPALCLKLGDALDYDGRKLLDQAHRARLPELAHRLGGNGNDGEDENADGGDDDERNAVRAQLAALEVLLPPAEYAKVLKDVQALITVHMHIANARKAAGKEA